MTNTALQVTDFDFYGDNLITLQDNSTGEIYTAISHILRGIGFKDKQIEYQQKRILTDAVIKNHTLKFLGVELNMPSINEIWCISIRKLPLALAKIHITPKIRKEQPELSQKLIRYQDKCADVLASVFIDRKSTDNINLDLLSEMIVRSVKPLYEEISTIKQSQEQIQKQLPKKKFSAWTSKMFPKYQLLMDYFGIDRKELYHNLYIEFANTYPDIDLNQEHDDYCFENGLDGCFTLDVIEHNKKLRELFTQMTNNLLKKYSLCNSVVNEYQRRETIFN